MKWLKSKDIIFFLGLFPFGLVFAFACPAGGVFRPLTTFLGFGARFSRGLPPGVLTFPWNRQKTKTNKHVSIYADCIKSNCQEVKPHGKEN